MAGQFQLKRKSSICVRIEEERGNVLSGSRTLSREEEALRREQAKKNDDGMPSYLDLAKTRSAGRPIDELGKIAEQAAEQEYDTDDLSETDTIELQVRTYVLLGNALYNEIESRDALQSIHCEHVSSLFTHFS